eukprot:10993832-Ditylum_brightwellii.AAC.1
MCPTSVHRVIPCGAKLMSWLLIITVKVRVILGDLEPTGPAVTCQFHEFFLGDAGGLGIAGEVGALPVML